MPHGSTANGERHHTNPGSYDLDGAKRVMLEALAWAAGQEHELTQRAYRFWGLGWKAHGFIRGM